MLRQKRLFPPLAAATLALGTLMLAGCGSSSPTTTTTEETTTAPSPTVPPPGSTTTTVTRQVSPN